jgi:hypothetical protein
VRLYCADGWEAYAAALISQGQLHVGKEETHGIERDHARQRHWLARFRPPLDRGLQGRAHGRRLDRAVRPLRRQRQDRRSPIYASLILSDEEQCELLL